MASKKPPIFELRIELEGVSPLIWRRFWADPLVTLPLLHLIIQDVMGWRNHHLHSFRIGTKRFGPHGGDSDDLWIDERRYRLRSLVKEPGDQFEYAYDFGDGWKHRVILERTLEQSRSVYHPKCIAGENACPPEDVGGPYGYDRLKLVLANPELSEYAEMRRWVGDHFDPSQFDLRYQNMSMWELRGTTPPWWARQREGH
jgi:hypothetical protein